MGFNLKNEVHKNMVSSPFPQQKLRGLGLQFSVIPKDEAQRLLIYLDQGSHLELATQALKERMTVDELVRRLIWSYNSF